MQEGFYQLPSSPGGPRTPQGGGVPQRSTRTYDIHPAPTASRAFPPAQPGAHPTRTLTPPPIPRTTTPGVVHQRMGRRPTTFRAETSAMWTPATLTPEIWASASMTIRAMISATPRTISRREPA
jgi:hypothetical protein